MPRGRINLTNPINRRHPLNRGLVSAWLPLENVKGGGTIRDVVRKNHGVINHAMTWASGPDGFRTLDGGGVAYVNLGAGLLPSAVATVCGAARVNVGSSGYRCLFSAFMGNPEAFEVFVHDEGTANTLGWGAYAAQALFPGVVVPGNWFHWALTSDGTTSRIYHNGVKGGTDGGMNWPSFATDTYYLGTRGGGFVWPGQIGGVWLYDRALTGPEVAQHFSQWRRRFPDLLNRRRVAVSAPAGGGGGAVVGAGLTRSLKLSRLSLVG